MFPVLVRKLGEKRRSLVTRLVLLTVSVVLIGYLALTAAVLEFIKSEISTLAAANQLAIANYAAEDIGGRVRSRLALLRRVAASLPPGLLEQPNELSDWLQTREQAFALFSTGLMVIPADGIGAIKSFAGDRERLDYWTTDWFIAARQQRGAVIGRPYRDPATGEPRIVMAYALRSDPRAPPIAVLAGVTALATPGFLDRLQHTRIGETGGFLLISPEDKLFVAATEPKMVLTDLPRAGVNKLHDRAMDGFRGSGITVNAFGVEELSAIASVPNTSWFLVARMPTAEAFRAVARARSFVLIGSLVIGLGVVALLLWLLPRFLRPLSAAARQMRLMALGKQPLSPVPLRRRDEIGEVISGFNFLLEKLQANEARMAHMAHHDALTGLPNRAMLLDRLGQACSRSARSGERFALLFLDLDGFKPINDTHGHDIGDKVLREVAHRLSGAVRRTDTVARLGGDEFVALLGGLAEPAKNVAAMTKNFGDAFAKPFEIDGLSLRLGSSIGSALCPEDGADPETLLAHADRAMYLAKTEGRKAMAAAD